MSSSATRRRLVDLKVNRELLDAQFEGYKLSLDKIPIKTLKLPQNVLLFPQSDSQWSFQHARIFSAHNHIHSDFGANSNLFLFLDDGGLYGVNFDQEKQNPWSDWTKVADLGLSPDWRNRGDKFPPSLVFPSKDWAVVTSGCGSLRLFSTGDRELLKPWQLEFDESVLLDECSFVLEDALVRVKGEEIAVDCLLRRILDKRRQEEDWENPDQDGTSSLFATEITWITLENAAGTFRERRRRQLITDGNLEFLCLHPDASSIALAASKPVQFIQDSLHPIITHQSPPPEAEVVAKYSWGQTTEQVCAVLTVGGEARKEEIQWRLGAKDIRLAWKDKELLNGELGGEVDVVSSTWTLDGDRLELTLFKRGRGPKWVELVVGDPRGEYVPDPETLRIIKERLQAFTSENLETGPVGSAYNSGQQLEECDDNTEANLLLWIHGDTHQIIQEIDIGGRQFLFSSGRCSDQSPSLCLRHDVDGLLWTPAPQDSSQPWWLHSATFSAFGYVQASKEQRKFSVCAPDHSYVCVVDCARHGYIYWQGLESDLRNRKTGRAIGKIAKQQVVTLDTNEDIWGVASSESVLFLLTENCLYAAVVKELIV